MFDATITNPSLNSHSLVSGLTDISLLKRSELEAIDLISASATNQQYWFPQQDSLANLAQLIQQDIEVPVGTFMEKSFSSRLYDQDFRDIDDLTGLEQLKAIFPGFSLNNTLPTINLRATDATAAETNSGQTANPGRFTLTRTGDLTNALTVNYRIAGTATKGTDYNNLTGRVTFAAGSNQARININPINDTTVEGNETVILTLANSANYTVGTANRATVTIADNDSQPLPTISIVATDAAAAEVNAGQTANPGRFTLTRTGNLSQALTVNYSLGGTAAKGNDYTLNYNNSIGVLTFAAGSATAIVTINVVNDRAVEGNETVILTLANSSNYTVGTANRATVTIADNDNPPATGGNLDWLRQFGTNKQDFGTSIATAADGSFYMAGLTDGTFQGQSYNNKDAWVARYAADGTRLWIRQISTPTINLNIRGNIRYETFNEIIENISIDHQGNLVVVGTRFAEGYTAFQGDPGSVAPIADYDIMVAKFDSNGNALWRDQENNPYKLYNFSWADRANDMTLDSQGNIYISGSVMTNYASGGVRGGAVILKLNSNGSLAWGNTIGEDFDTANAIALDNQGNVYVTGEYGSDNYNLNQDAWAAKYNNNGVFQWAIDVVVGSQRDVGEDIAVDNNGNFYIVGRTTQPIPNENKVVSTWVRKFKDFGQNAEEDQSWTRKFPVILSSSTQVNTYNSVKTDTAGNVYLAEFQNQATGRDFSLIHKYSSAGNLIWKTPVQGPLDTVVETTDITFDRNGNVIIVGYTIGNVGGPSAGQTDVFFARLSNSITTTSQAVASEQRTTAKSQNQIKSFAPSRTEFDSLLSQPILTSQMLKPTDKFFSLDFSLNHHQRDDLAEFLPYALAQL
jgi:hypothetical protein